MKRPQEIAMEEKTMGTIVLLTNAFEGLASMRIAQVRNQVLQSQQYFAGIWQIYHQIRVDGLFHFGRQQTEDVINKTLYIAVTAEGGFSGDIDHRLITELLDTYKPKKHDLLVIGHHGALQLAQAGVQYTKYFKLPEANTNINVAPLVAEIRKYRSAVVYYQTYVSLMTQEVRRIELSEAIETMGKQVIAEDEIISEKNYIFEPSTYRVVAHLERSMLDITLRQVILDSKLAQYASRFRAMRVANERSSDEHKAMHINYNRAKRAQSDERLKEIINGLKKMSVTA
jgi:ATP synthase F1 gamma subunit